MNVKNVKNKLILNYFYEDNDHEAAWGDVMDLSFSVKDSYILGNRVLIKFNMKADLCDKELINADYIKANVKRYCKLHYSVPLHTYVKNIKFTGLIKVIRIANSPYFYLKFGKVDKQTIDDNGELIHDIHSYY